MRHSRSFSAPPAHSRLLAPLATSPPAATMADDAPKGDKAMLLRNKVRAGDLIQIKALLKEGADFAAKGNTTRQWTPLHIACWGTSKPQNDREIVEAILLAAQKAGKESDVRNAKDAKDGATPADLAKERRETQTGSNVDDKEQLDEKRKLDKIIEWVRRAAARRTRRHATPAAASPTHAALLPRRSSRRACRRRAGRKLGRLLYTKLPRRRSTRRFCRRRRPRRRHRRRRRPRVRRRDRRARGRRRGG